MPEPEPAVVDFLRYIADPSRDFDRDLFDSCLTWATESGYVSVQSKGQIVLTPHGRLRLSIAAGSVDDA